MSAARSLFWLVVVGTAHLDDVTAFFRFNVHGNHPACFSSSNSVTQCVEWTYSVHTPVKFETTEANHESVPSESQAVPSESQDQFDHDHEMVLKIARTAFMFADMDSSLDLSFDEVFEMMQRIIGHDNSKRSKAHERAMDMFTRFDMDWEDDSFSISYAQFSLYLKELTSESELFKSLLNFAEDIVSNGVLERLNGGLVGSIRSRGQGSHILDDGSESWRDSVEAAFDLVDKNEDGQICNRELIEAAVKYPLINQLMRVPVHLNEQESLAYMAALFEKIDEDGSTEISQEEWFNYFCSSSEVNHVPRADKWNTKENPDCRKISGFIFDVDGTLNQPQGVREGAEDVLTWILQSGFQFALLSNSGSLSFTKVHEKMTIPGGLFELRPRGKTLPEGVGYTALDAQVDFITSGHMPEGSKLLVLAPENSCWKDMVRERDVELYNSWDIRLDMDVEQAKEWAQIADARHKWENLSIENRVLVEPPPKVAVVFFHDGEVATDWTFEMLQAMTILFRFGAEFIYTSEDATIPSIDERYPGMEFPVPGPGMFVEMMKKSMLIPGRCFCSGKGGNVGRKFMIERAIEMLKLQGHSGNRDHIMIVGDRYDTDIRAGTFAGIKSCLLETGDHTIDQANEYPTDIPSFTANSINDLPY